MRAGARAEGLGCRNGCVHCERVKVGRCNAQLCTHMYSVLDGLWFLASIIVLKLKVYSQFYSFCLFVVFLLLPGSSAHVCLRLLCARVWVVREGEVCWSVHGCVFD